MKYEIDFNNNSVDNYFRDIYCYFSWSEISFELGCLLDNIKYIMEFKAKIDFLKIFGVVTECVIESDKDFLRIKYARIKNFDIVNNGKINSNNLTDALWEIAHPEK